MANVMQCVKSSRAVENRPTENQAIRKIIADQLGKNVEDRSYDAYRTITRRLVKMLFSAKNEREIDAVIKGALALNASYKAEFGKEVHFELRVRNAELNARRALQAGITVEPTFAGVVCQLERNGEPVHTVLVDSWGKLTQLLYEGYRIIQRNA